MSVYLDHNATTPVVPEARRAMDRALDEAWGNPSSVHRPGQAARLAVEEARAEVAALVGAMPSEVVFTGSGTEADNLALRGVLDARPGAGLVIGGLEHEAVRECADLLGRRGHPVTVVPPGPGGRLEAERVVEAIDERTALVSLIAASNVIGTLQPVAEVAAACRERGVLTHSDAVQVAGRLPLDRDALGVDLLALSSHKMGGPKGAGALVVRRGLDLEPLVCGGGQEFRRRSGTEAVPALAGFGAAACRARETMGAWEATGPLRDRLERGLLERHPGARVVGAGEPRLPNTSAALLPGERADDLVVALDLAGYQVSAGSACHSGGPKPDGALSWLSPEDSRSVLRASLGPGSTRGDVDGFLAALEVVLQRAATAREVTA